MKEKIEKKILELEAEKQKGINLIQQLQQQIQQSQQQIQGVNAKVLRIDGAIISLKQLLAPEETAPETTPKKAAGKGKKEKK